MQHKSGFKVNLDSRDTCKVMKRKDKEKEKEKREQQPYLLPV